MIGRTGEQGARRLGPEIRGGNAEQLFRLKVVEERPFRHPCCLAEIVHRRCGKTLLPNDVPGGFQKARARNAALG